MLISVDKPAVKILEKIIHFVLKFNPGIGIYRKLRN
jgi:hypothetical protein